MTEAEYWTEVNEKYNSLKKEFKERYERSIDTEYIFETVLSEIRPIWSFTNWIIGYNGNEPFYDGGILRFSMLDLQNGNRDFNNRQHLELDAYLKFEKYLEGDDKGVSSYHLGTTLREEYKKISDAEKLKQLLFLGNLDSFFTKVQAVFADIPYAINKSKEGYFHSHIHLLLRMIGAKIISEISTNIGRIDSVIELSNFIYVIEFKIGTADEALKQIQEKKYYQKYLNDERQIRLVGVACSEKEKNIIDWKYIDI